MQVEITLRPNQVIHENEETIHIVEINDFSQDKSMSSNSNGNTEHQKNRNPCNPNVQDNAINVDENDIEVLEIIDDATSNSPSPNMIFPLDPVDSTADATEVYKDTREHKSISKFVTVTSLLLVSCFLWVLYKTFVRAYMGFGFSAITNIILFMLITVVCKLIRTFLVIFSSIFCFELIRSLFSTITIEIVEFFQSAHNRFISYF